MRETSNFEIDLLVLIDRWWPFSKFIGPPFRYVPGLEQEGRGHLAGHGLLNLRSIYDHSGYQYL